MHRLARGTTQAREVSGIRVLRALAGSLLWILACVVGLVGILLSVTLILLPVGIPLLLLARKLFRYSLTFFLPRVIRHPAQELRKKSSDTASDTADSMGLSRKNMKRARKSGRKAGKKARKALAGS
jgi:uncharacterized RDD family membrane protein YckC